MFIAGGMTFSEVRECYQLSTPLNKDIYIGKLSCFSSRLLAKITDVPGSTHTISPRHFVDDLKVLELGGVGSRAIPNGLREDRQKRSFQEFYDEKYYTKDAPPPPRAAPASLPVPKQQKPSRISPTNSFASSVNSTTTPSVKEEKKKKKGGLFRF